MRSRQWFFSFFAFLFIHTVCFTITNGQDSAIFGVVKNADTNKLLPGVNIFLDQTTVGAFTDKTGAYQIKNLPSGSYTLVFSFIGFERFEKKVTFPLSSPKEINVFLKPDNIQMDELTVEDQFPKEWQKNLEKFKSLFLGYSQNAEDTRILNPEVLNFSNKDGIFTATAVKPLIVKNEALGYEIKFFLDKMEAFNNRLRIDGVSKFNELEPGSAKQSQHWLEERNRAYKGSFDEFIHALINEELINKGYKINFVNSKRATQYFNSDGSPKERQGIEVDHPNYLWNYRGLNQISFAPYKKYNYLRVKFVKEQPDFKIAKKANIAGSKNQVSYLQFPKGKSIININSMSFEDPYRIVYHGYWAWSTLVPEWLPKNYTSREIN